MFEIYPDKIKIFYCKDSNRNGNHENIEFTFLGYTFRARKAKRKNNIEFTSFLPAISSKSKSHIRKEVKEWQSLLYDQ